MGRTAGAVRVVWTTREQEAAALANLSGNVGKKVRRTAAERSPPQANKSRGQAIGDRPTTRLGKAENAPHCEGRIVAGTAATGRDSTRWHARRDRRGSSRPVATGYRRPATPARTTRPRRSDRPRSGRQPRLSPRKSRRSTRDSRLANRCVSARGTARHLSLDRRGATAQYHNRGILGPIL